MKTIDQLAQELTAAAQKRLAAQIETARHDYQEGMNDCKMEKPRAIAPLRQV